MRYPLIKIVVACLSFSTFALADDEVEIDFDAVPENVLNTAQDIAPGVSFYRISFEIENGIKIYEFEAHDFEGKHVEIDVLEDGTLEEIEMETALSDVPEIVTLTLEEAMPGFEPSYIELSIRDNGAAFVYEFEGDYKGDAIDIEISEDGEILVFTGEAFS